jgi:hypothetical protein
MLASTVQFSRCGRSRSHPRRRLPGTAYERSSRAEAPIARLRRRFMRAEKASPRRIVGPSPQDPTACPIPRLTDSIAFPLRCRSCTSDRR